MEQWEKSNRAKKSSDGDSWELLISGDRKQSLRLLRLFVTPPFSFHFHRTQNNINAHKCAHICAQSHSEVSPPIVPAEKDGWGGSSFWFSLHNVAEWFSLWSMSCLSARGELILPYQPHALPLPPPYPSCCSEDCLPFSWCDWGDNH